MLMLALILAACGQSSSPGPSPTPTPAPAPSPAPSPNPTPTPVPPSNTFNYTTIAAQPYLVSESQGRAVGGKLYVFGGFDSTQPCCTPTNRAQVYDPAANTWTPIKPMPVPTTHSGITTDGTNLYYAGGYTPGANGTGQTFGSKLVYRYNVASNDYTPLPDLPTERAAGALEYLNGKLHYFGGTNRYEKPGATGNDVGDHYVLDLSKLGAGWTTATTSPLPNARHHLGSAVLGGHIYAIGGQHGHDDQLVTQREVDRYDPATDQWTRVADLPALTDSGMTGMGLSHMSNSTFVLGGRIVVAGGEAMHDHARSEVTAYDPATNSWATLTPLPRPRASAVAAAFGNSFIFTAGNDAGGDGVVANGVWATPR